MKKNFKKLLTIGLAIVMTLSCSLMAFAYGEFDVEAPLGDSYMDCHVDVDGSYAHASISAGVTSDFSIDGYVEFVNSDDEIDNTVLYGGAEQEYSYGTWAHRTGSYMYYADATFQAWSNDGGYNSVYINCVG